MSTVTHTPTPGPWEIATPTKTGGALGDAGDRGIHAGPIMIAEAWEHCPSKNNPDGVRVDAMANARLIAAAPDLYAALKALVESPLRYNGHRIEIDCTDHADAMRRVSEARAALKKVGG